MHLEFTDEQEELRRVVRDFARSEIAPYAGDWAALASAVPEPAAAFMAMAAVVMLVARRRRSR